MQDVRSRYINDIIWVIAAIALAPILFFEIFIGEFDLFATILSVIFAVGVAYPLSRIGFLGQADVFALALLALYMPTLNKELLSLPVLAVIANASIFSLLGIFVNLSRNLFMLLQDKEIFRGFEEEPRHRKIVAMFLGYRTETAAKLVLPMESRIDGKRKFDFDAWRSSSDFAVENDIWITPALPFIVYVTVGYIFLFFVGDILHMFKSLVF
jgi:preflagellin peptidase FlaK